MAAKRTTVDISTIVMAANRMISHLSTTCRPGDTEKREAIIAVTSAILLDGNAYNGFRYLDEPRNPQPGEIGLQYDDTRVQFLG